MAALITDAQSALLDYATAAWIDLAPALVVGLEDELRALRPGTTLGGQPILVTPGLLALSASQRSSPSPLAAHPPSDTGLSAREVSESFASLVAPSPSPSPVEGTSGRRVRRLPKRLREQFDGVAPPTRPATPDSPVIVDNNLTAEDVRVLAFVKEGPLPKEQRPSTYGTVRGSFCLPRTVLIVGSARSVA